MKVFISSLIGGMEPYRAAAKAAIESLGFEAVMAEGFGAQPVSSQVACLQGIRASDAVVLILGERYGVPQASGLSPTHEEFREARDSKPIFAFKLAGIDPEAPQAGFIDEAGAWEAGLFREEVDSPQMLAARVARKLHEWTVSRAAGTVDGRELLDAALSVLPAQQRGYYSQTGAVIVAVAGGPRQTILRPSDMDAPLLSADIKQAMLFGPVRLFAEVRDLESHVSGNVLAFRYGGGEGNVSVDTRGTVMVSLPLPSHKHAMIVVEEDVTNTLALALGFVDWVLERIDPSQRLTHVAPVAMLPGSTFGAWMTRKEADASGGAFTANMDGERTPVFFEPPARPRASLRHQKDELVDDFVALLRRGAATRNDW